MRRPTLLLVLVAAVSAILPRCGSSEEPDYEHLIYPTGPPPLAGFRTGQPTPAVFETLGHVSGTDGIAYVLYSLRIPAEHEETHDVYLAALNGGIVRKWSLTSDLPMETEPGSGVVLDLEGCVSYSAELNILHVGLWSMLSGTGGANGSSELFWSLPLNRNRLPAAFAS